MEVSARRGAVALHAVVLVVSAASIGVAWWLTRTAWFRGQEGIWHVHALRATFVFLPASLLLAAFAVQWAIRRRPALAAIAVLPILAWVASLHCIRQEVPPGATEAIATNGNLVVNDLWFALIMLPMQGIEPFGGA